MYHFVACLLSHRKEKRRGAEETPQLAGEFATGEDHCPLSALLDLGPRVFTAQLKTHFPDSPVSL